MCTNTTETDRILRLLEDWLLVAHPDTLHDLQRHLDAINSTISAVGIVNALGRLALRDVEDVE